MTTIADTLTYEDGRLVNGQIVVSTLAFQMNGVSVAASQQAFQIVNGVVNLSLYPNVNAQPAGTYYIAVYELEEGDIYTEYWIVPDLTTVKLGQVRVAFPPAPSVLISAQQLTSAGATFGQFLGWNGSHWVPMYVTTINVTPNTIALGVTNLAGSDLAVTGSPAALGQTLVLNVPDAGSASRGVVTTGAQTFAGQKTFTDGIIASGTSTIAGYVPTTTQVATGYGLAGGGALTGNLSLSVVDDTNVQRIMVQLATVLKSTRSRLNFIQGANVTISIADNPSNNSADVTFQAVGGGSGPSLPAGATLGDILIWQPMPAPGNWEVLPCGSAGQVLTVATGTVWAAPAVASVFGRTGAVAAATGDYTAAQVTNAVSVLGSYANPAWITSLAWSKLTGIPTNVGLWQSGSGGAIYYNAGSVGIGTTSPQVIFQAGISPSFGGIEPRNDGPTGAANYVRLGGFYVSNPIPGAAIGLLAQGSGGQRGSIALMTKSLDDSTSQPTIKVWIDQGGNVGIGTTSPNTTLAVQGVIHAYPSGATPDDTYNGSMRITKPNPAGQLINLTLQGQAAYSIGFVYNTNIFAIGPGQKSDTNFTNPPFVITSVGNVGIGTVSPGALLGVAYPSALTSGQNTAVFSASGQPNASQIHYGASGDIYWRSASNAGKVILQDTGGNVGIGTATPNATLNVKVSGNPDSTGQPSGTFAAIIYYANNTPGANGLLVKNNWAASTSTVFEAGTDFVGGAYKSYLHVGGDGNVGIGTASPESTLAVHGSHSNPALNSSAGSLATFTSDTSVQIQFGAISGGSYGGWLQVKADSQNTAYPLCLQPAGGSVGIGTTSPAALYHQNGGFWALQTNTGSSFPPTAVAIGLVIGNNYSQAAGETNFWNMYTAAGFSFTWRQVTSASASTQLMSLSASGNLSVAGSISVAGSFVQVAGDIGCARGANLGVVYFGTNGGQYIYFDGSKWNFSPALSITASLRFYHANAEVSGSPSLGLNFLDSTGWNWNMSFSGTTWVSAQLVQSSDQRLKRNIKKLEGGLSVVTRLEPRSFEYNGLGGTVAGRRSAGIVAQELQAVLPDAVEPYRKKLRPDDQEAVELLSPIYPEVMAHLILAVKQLSGKVEALEKQLERKN